MPIAAIRHINIVAYEIALTFIKGNIMKEYIKYIPLSLFIAFSIKMLVNGSSLQDAPIFVVLAAMSIYLVTRDEQEKAEKLNQRLVVLEKASEQKSKEIEDLRSHVSSVKLGQQIKSVGRF